MANPTQTNKPFAKEIIFALLLSVGFIAFLVVFSKNWFFEVGHPLEGKKAPEIEYMTSDGKSTSLNKQEGTTILMNFWASWCEPCMEEMPSLVALESHYASKGLLLLAFNIEDSAGANIQGKIAGTQMPRNVIYNFNKDSMRPYNVSGVPLTVLIDKKGIVRRVYQGPRDWMRVENLKDIESILDN